VFTLDKKSGEKNGEKQTIVASEVLRLTVGDGAGDIVKDLWFVVGGKEGFGVYCGIFG
jgi:hypothetical protein